METKISNKEEDMRLGNKKVLPIVAAILSDELRNKIPPGSYFIKDGKLIPEDEATKNRFNLPAEGRNKRSIK